MTWMELDRIMPSEVSQKRQIRYGFTHVWNLRTKQTNTGGGEEKQTKKQTLNIENKLMVMRQEWGGRSR